MDIIFKEELAYTWCRMNDKGSFYNNSTNRFWTKDRVSGAMRVIENFVDKKTLTKCWKKYINRVSKWRNKIFENGESNLK